ncbi:hypothetical protein SAMN05660443_1527 [Marinospirillum celere]|uniref:Uncharacterized protein n=1 Tax=Marinospirillum celere TaxID=1122252 RepID=A0A1I1GSG8_9GAMM|nr:hypothetical protein [Marinospirillum celere]SFC12818.1 hypothetical protein SAMN05660443_1527 [Marinospirillum celere]
MNTFKKAAQKRLKQQGGSLKKQSTSTATPEAVSEDALIQLSQMIEELEQQSLTPEYRTRLLQKLEALQAYQRQVFHGQLPPGPYN